MIMTRAVCQTISGYNNVFMLLTNVGNTGALN